MFGILLIIIGLCKRRYEAQHAAPIPSLGKFYG